MKILIVEDEPVLQLMLEQMVVMMGHQVKDTARKGSEAVEKALTDDFDLILMDIMLADQIDGIDAYKLIRTQKFIPVIYITSNTDPYNKKRAQKMGYHDYIGKPVVFSLLKNSIREITLTENR